MKTADLISSYLNNEMSPEQERQFLLSVAASDALRLSLKSHFMLDRIVSDQAQRAHVPEIVRTSIFAHATAALAGSEPSMAPSKASEPAAAAPAARMRRGRAFGRGALMALMLASGFGVGYLAHSELTEVRVAATPVSVHTAAVPSVPPSITEPVVTDRQPIMASTSVTPGGNDHRAADRRHASTNLHQSAERARPSTESPRSPSGNVPQTNVPATGTNSPTTQGTSQGKSDPNAAEVRPTFHRPDPPTKKPEENN